MKYTVIDYLSKQPHMVIKLDNTKLSSFEDLAL